MINNDFLHQYYPCLFDNAFIWRDDTPHIWNDTILNIDWVYDIISNQTHILNKTFPNIDIFSAIGNHDWSPKNQLPPHTHPFYDKILDLWRGWVPEAETETFKKGEMRLWKLRVRHLNVFNLSTGAYYTAQINAKIQMVVLNTNLYYDSNALTENLYDPANQLQWFDDIMTDIADHGKKV